MKTLQESIIGRKGAPVKFTKSMLKSGYIVQYQDTNLAMYFDYQDIKKINNVKEILPFLHNQGCFLGLDWEHDLEYAQIFLYNDNLTIMEPFHHDDMDIISVWCVNMQPQRPQILDQESLEKLIKNVNPIKINQ